MRLRNIPGSQKIVDESPLVIKEAEKQEDCGKSCLETTILFILRWEWEKESF